MHIAIQLSLPDKQLKMYKEALCKSDHTVDYFNIMPNNEVVGLTGIPDITFCSADLVKRYLESDKVKGIFGGSIRPVPANYTDYAQVLGHMMLNWDYSYFPEKPSFKTYFKNVFIRPNTDCKPFDTRVCFGTVDVLGDIKDFIIAPIKPIELEMRFFISNKNIIGHSIYKTGSIVEWTREVPEDAWHFVNMVINFYNPCQQYCIDVCTSLFDYKVIEYNCINCSCTYDADIRHIVDNFWEQK